MAAARVLRIDLDTESGTLAPPRQLPTGSWVIEGYATRAGVFRYLEPDGTPRLEYRSPEEVEKSAPNLVHSILTNQHPDGRVSPKNANALQQGVVLEAAWEPDAQRIKVSCLVTTEELLESIGSGRRELSCGYEAEVVPEAGVSPTGEPFTHVQRDIQHNHLAVVDAGRAGPTCALRLDAHGDAVQDAPSAPVTIPPVAATSTAVPPGPAKEQVMQKVVINGVEYEIPEAAAAALMAERALWEKKVEEAKSGEVAALEDVKEEKALVVAADAAKVEAVAKADAAETARKNIAVKLDEAKDEVRRLKSERADASSDETVNKRVAARTALQLQVAPVLGANYDYSGTTDDKIRIDALEKVLEGKESSKKRLAGYIAAKNTGAVAALFEHVMEERADAAGTALGHSHSPAPGAQPTVDPFLAGAENLKKAQRTKPA